MFNTQGNAKLKLIFVIESFTVFLEKPLSVNCAGFAQTVTDIVMQHVDILLVNLTVNQCGQLRLAMQPLLTITLSGLSTEWEP